MATKFEPLLADITELDVDAIVNAANPRLLGGGGVDGAIHRAAGSGLLDECRSLPEVSPGVRCPTGQARLTRGHDLPARYVIHTVGPYWEGGGQKEDELLASCYRACYALAAQHGIKSIAFPAISTGIYGFPADRAAQIAVHESRIAAESLGKTLARVVFACFDRETHALYQDWLAG